MRPPLPNLLITSPQPGGAERKIGESYGHDNSGEKGSGECIDWSRDGKYLIVADKMAPEDSRSSILLLAVEDGQRKVVVSSPPCMSVVQLFTDGNLVAMSKAQVSWLVTFMSASERRPTPSPDF